MDEGIFIKHNNYKEDVYSEFDHANDNQFEEESLEHVLASLQQNLNNSDPQYEDNPKASPTKKRSSDSRFTIQEDKLILKLVFQVGPNFNKIVKHFPGKTMNMVKNRYYKKLRYLKDDLQSDQEDSKKPSKSKRQQSY